MAFVDINNPQNYKSCAKKLYDIHVCMPPKGTIVINKLEQYDVLQLLGNKEYYTIDDLQKLQQSDRNKYSLLQQLSQTGKLYVVNDSIPFVLAGTIGEMWCVTPDSLASNYGFIENGQVVAINQQTLNSRMKNNCLSWTLIRSKRKISMSKACFVPVSQKGQIQEPSGAVLNYNYEGVHHGKGDFILCDMLPNGMLNLQSKRVVNGKIFAATYNNQG